MSKLAALLIAAAAVAAALVLLALGRRRLYVDAVAARTLRGRFLLAVAFFLALFAGWMGRDVAAAPPPTAREAMPAAKSVEETAEWKTLSSAWKDAEEVASGKRGDYPFDKAGQQKLLDALDKAGKDAHRFAAAGLLTAAETGLLKMGLADLATGVMMKHPTEMRESVCYAPMPLQVPAKASAARLADRLPLLRQLVEDKKLHPVAAEKTLGGIEADLAVLSEKANLDQLDAKGRADAEKLRGAVKEQLDRVKALLKDAPKSTATD